MSYMMILIFIKCIIIINSKSAESTVVRTLSRNGNNIPLPITRMCAIHYALYMSGKNVGKTRK